jgi:UDP-glucose 4-epimerase
MSDVLLITGAAGFIGRHLCAELIRQAHDIIAIDREPERLASLPIGDHGTKRLVDIRNAEAIDSVAQSLKAVRIPTLIHLAAVASPRIAEKLPDVAWATNVQGTYNVLRLAQTVGIRRVLFFSTAHVYGISPKYFPTDESHPLALQDVYTSTKIAGESLCKLFFDNYGISYTTLRLFNGYGPGQSPDYFIGAKIRQARDAVKRVSGYACQFEAGARIVLGAAYQDPSPFTMPWQKDVTKDWVHVDDIVDATVRALETEFVGPINIGTGVETSLESIVNWIATETGATVEPDENRYDGGPSRMRCDYGRAMRTLEWQPKRSFEFELRKLVQETV